MVLYGGDREAMQRRYEELCRVTEAREDEPPSEELDRLVSERVLLARQLRGECLTMTIKDLVADRFK